MPEKTRAPAPKRSFSDLLLTLGRPLLRISLFLYLREVRDGVYPRDLPVRTLAGSRTLTLLFFGDITVSGHGVLSYGLTVEARTSDFVAAATDRGVHWDVVSAADLTMAQVAGRSTLDAQGVDVVLLLMGIPDVLLITRSEQWARDLRCVVAAVKREAGEDARVVVAGIPPMSDFRPIPSPLRGLIDKQVHRLNEASRAVAESDDSVVYLPFPIERVSEMYIQQQFSWRTMHALWARSLADAVVARLP
ncbi:SGNH/GDSL hydrolase family protein [Frondihabitans cladoniiphilus]|uniref:SGNH/GDSL hydrolase family protein n=1 Tax=Frondihabitans cladoniiphilus TaxID=715785 RepID=A0ABP8VXK3_9MICO